MRSSSSQTEDPDLALIVGNWSRLERKEPPTGTWETWVAPNAAHKFHRLFKYLMVA
jgi:hypothetical protein